MKDNNGKLINFGYEKEIPDYYLKELDYFIPLFND